MESNEPFPTIMVAHEGQLEGLDFKRLRRQVDVACDGLNVAHEANELFEEVEKQFFNGITPKEISRAMVLAARAKIEQVYLDTLPEKAADTEPKAIQQPNPTEE